MAVWVEETVAVRVEEAVAVAVAVWVEESVAVAVAVWVEEAVAVAVAVWVGEAVVVTVSVRVAVAVAVPVSAPCDKTPAWVGDANCKNHPNSKAAAKTITAGQRGEGEGRSDCENVVKGIMLSKR